MLEQLLSQDSALLVYLNGLGSSTFDPFWLTITDQINWLPFFLLLAYLVFKKFGTKQALIFILFVAALIAFTDQTTNLFKNGFQRLRPCNNPEINSILRLSRTSASFSFFSGHAANSMAAATFLYLNFRLHYRKFYFIFLWPMIFAYSRIYLGLHYPIDIMTGYFFGFTFGLFMYIIYQLFQRKFFPIVQ